MINENRLIELLEEEILRIDTESTPGCGNLYGRDASVMKNTLNFVIDLINEQPKVNEWIPFNKEEPKEEGLYLCCFDDGFITTVEYEDGDWNLWADSGEVVAWQTLPEPYKGD